MTINVPTQPLSLWGIWKTSFKLVGARFWQLYPFFLLGPVATFVVSYYVPLQGEHRLNISVPLPPHAPLWALGILLLLNFVLIFIFAFAQHQVGKLWLTGPCSWRESFAVASKKYFSLLMGTFLFVCLTLLGFVVFIVPGIFLMVVFFVYYPLIIFDNFSVIGATQQAFKMVWGQWWRTFGIIVANIILLLVLKFSIEAIVGVSTLSMMMYPSDNMYFNIVDVLTNGFISFFSTIFMVVIWYNIKLRYQAKLNQTTVAFDQWKANR